MNGNLFLNGKNVIFSFDDNTLNVYCQNGEAKEFLFKEEPGTGHLISCKKPLPKSLNGTSFDDKCPVYFEIYSEGYGFNSDFFAENAVLKINVRRYYLTKSYENEIFRLVFSSKQYFKFLGSTPFYELNLKKSVNVATAKINKDYYKHTVNLNYKNYLIKIKVGPSLRANALLDITPQIVMSFDKEPKYSDVLYLTNQFIKILSFFFMRTNIYPDSIVYFGRNTKNEIVYCLPKNYIKENEDINSIQTIGSIKWKHVFDKLQLIFDDFIKENINLHFLDSKSSDRLYVDFDKASRDSAFFESTFDLIFGRFNKSLSKIDNDFSNLLTDFVKDKNRKYKKRAEFILEDLKHVSLQDKINKIFCDYADCLKKAKTDFNLASKTDSEIASICANNRNSIDHGRKKKRISQETASAFAFLRVSTYAMWLRRWGLDDKTISNCLVDLYRIKI